MSLGYRGHGIVIHKDSVIGDNVKIGSNVTLGGNARESGAPVIEDDTYVTTGANILGLITVGRGAVVAANTVVIRDVSSGAVVGVVPARIIRENVDINEFLFHRRMRGDPNTDRACSEEEGNE